MDRLSVLHHVPRRSDLDAHPPPFAAGPSAPAPPRGAPTRRVLIADDEVYIVDLLSILLEEEGFQVVRAYDGEQAWELAERLQPDLVISDVTMPRVGGLELLRRFRSDGPLRDTPVILMSAVARGIEGERAAFLPKPFDLDRMLSLVETELTAD